MVYEDKLYDLDDTEGEKQVIKWIQKFIKDGYSKKLDLSLGVSRYWKSEFYCIQEEDIKKALIYRSKLTIEDLLDYRKELALLGGEFDDLNDIMTDDDSECVIEEDFKFTWENLLEKFHLPRTHKYTVLPDGVLPFE